jgi:hypothetical protein
MAIGAGHESFVDAMLEGQGELAANVVMATITEFGLALDQQEFRNGRFVNGVTIGADHVIQGVGGAANVGAAQGLGVASETVVQNLHRLKLRKSDDGSFAATRLHVGLARAVTGLASSAFGRFFAGGDALVMWVLVEVGPNVGVAGTAYVTTDEAGGGRRLRLSFDSQPAEKEDQDAETPHYRHFVQYSGAGGESCTKKNGGIFLFQGKTPPDRVRK